MRLTTSRAIWPGGTRFSIRADNHGHDRRPAVVGGGPAGDLDPGIWDASAGETAVNPATSSPKSNAVAAVIRNVRITPDLRQAELLADLLPRADKA
jgi:hypothetical protein